MYEVTEESRSTSNFAELSRSECEKLLAEHSVGRVGVSAPTGPQILPVNYAYYGKTVVFRTSPYGVLSSLERHTRVAFEIDDIDEEAQSGWSVLVRGIATFVGTDDVSRDETLQPFAWAAGGRTLLVRVSPRSVSGRRLLPG